MDVSCRSIYEICSLGELDPPHLGRCFNINTRNDTEQQHCFSLSFCCRPSPSRRARTVFAPKPGAVLLLQQASAAAATAATAQ